MPQLLFVVDHAAEERKAGLPKNFRESKHPDLLHYVVSGQLNADEYEAAFAMLNQTFANKAGKFVVVAFRHEDHGFLPDGRSITLLDPYSEKITDRNILPAKRLIADIMQNKSDVTIYTQPKEQNKDQGGELVSHETIKLGSTDQIIAEPERLASLAAELGVKIKYVEIPVVDHFNAGDMQINDFVNLVRNSDPNDKFLFHCHGGKGRSSFFIALFILMRLQANEQYSHELQEKPLAEIIKEYADDESARKLFGPAKDKKGRIASIGSVDSMFSGEESIDVVNERLGLLEEFLQYAKDSSNGFAAGKDWLSYIEHKNSSQPRTYPI